MLFVACAKKEADPTAEDPPQLGPQTKLDYGTFQLKPEPSPPCRREDSVDVNLGHTPENFVKNAHCQITGKQAPEDVVAEWSEKLRTGKNVRRVDVVRSLCKAAVRPCTLSYSDPWEAQTELTGAPVRTTKREIGAVSMFFFGCPGGTNCQMWWANTHAPGMASAVPSLGFGSAPKGFYVSSNPGFWRRELLDAQYAGLSFLMLNAYGPDLENNALLPLATALASIEAPIKIALFDDTWTWGEPYFEDKWTHKPDLAQTDAAAQTLFDAKWKPFFSQLDKKHWYRFKGKPFIYFYNGGKLDPRSASAPVLEKMKALFLAEFGEEPFLSVDTAYFEDTRMPQTADTNFLWYTFGLGNNRYRSTLNGHIVDHAMVRWDTLGRDTPDAIAGPNALQIKDSAVLEKVLAESKDAELLVLATWNDLGEGSGVNRNYDYYVRGEWWAPDHFIQLIRKSQSE